MQTRFVQEVRAIPLWLLREYLAELGGQTQSDGILHGEEWTARLTQIEDYQIGSLRVGQVRMEITGEADAVAQVQTLLTPKLLRAGG